ncbi:hypothetical protein [Butyrivibrio sp. M55]|uniref:hypothetical protein n=1 Tax=Butyrivibrio sp. M55 TaxID=1855323 RepID=UPI0008E6F746|nr:hypothetical protein [Butyrivibrio sp. M55]SFU84406.1 hypothetical protein SAMN05216540_11375 [Butyrivibrio sp. M55]
MYENLFVYALLYSVGYDTIQQYRELLDAIVLANPKDYEAMELQDMSDKETILHTLAIMDSVDFDKDSFGQKLMGALKEIYEGISDITVFGNRMYELWNHLPGRFNMEEPFYTLSYADDCLSIGDEKQCRELYEKSFGFYGDCE